MAHCFCAKSNAKHSKIDVNHHFHAQKCPKTTSPHLNMAAKLSEDLAT